MPVKNALDAGDEEAAFKQLKIAFQKKIIPLLQEYFFDDWNKIRLVLADNQKQDDNLQFVIEKPTISIRFLVTTMVYDAMISNQQLMSSKISIKRSGRSTGLSFNS